MPISSSASRTPVAEAAGARSQLTSVVARRSRRASCWWRRPGLLAGPPDRDPRRGRHRGRAVAGRVGAIARLWRVGSSEFWLALASFLGVAFVGRHRGRRSSRSALSLLAFIRRAWWPHDAVLGRADGVKGYHDLTYYPEARQVPGLVLYRFDAPLFFANADVFRDRIRERIATRREPVRWVVVAAEPITDVDTTAAAMLDRLEAELAAPGITLAFAELKDPVRARLRGTGRSARPGRADLPDRRDGRVGLPQGDRPVMDRLGRGHPAGPPTRGR